MSSGLQISLFMLAWYRVTKDDIVTETVLVNASVHTYAIKPCFRVPAYEFIP